MLAGKGFIERICKHGDRGELVINLELPKDATIQQTNLKTQEASNTYCQKPKWWMCCSLQWAKWKQTEPTRKDINQNWALRW